MDPSRADLDFDSLRGAFASSPQRDERLAPDFLPQNIEEIQGDDMVYQSLAMDVWEPAKTSLDDGFQFEMVPADDWELPTFNSSVFHEGFHSSPLPSATQAPLAEIEASAFFLPEPLSSSGSKPRSPSPRQNNQPARFPAQGSPNGGTGRNSNAPSPGFAQQQAQTFPDNSRPSGLFSSSDTLHNIKYPKSPEANQTTLPKLLPGVASAELFGNSSTDEIAELKQKNQQLESMLTMVYNMFLQQEERLNHLQQQMDILQGSNSASGSQNDFLSQFNKKR